MQSHCTVPRALLLGALLLVACGGEGGGPAPAPDGVSFRVPVDGATLAAPSEVSVTGDGVTKVTFSIDGTVRFEDDEAPFSWTLEPEAYEPGDHQLTVRASTSSGEESVSVQVTIAARDPQPGGQPTLDPGFAAPTNRIELHYDSTLTSARNGDRLEAAIEALRAGDLLVIGSGTYTVSGRISVQVEGTAENTVKIAAAEGAKVHVHRPDENQNLIDFDYVRYLTVEGIEWSGGSIGLRFIDAQYVFLYRNEIHDTGDAAVTANSGNTAYLYLVDNHVHHTGGTGEGFYLGANYGTHVTHHTYVVGNHVHDTLGTEQGDGIEIKDGSYACVIADNLIERTNYPGILVYGTQGNGERNVIERNTIVDSREGGIQVAADAIVRNNLIIDADHACIVSQSHQTATPKDLTIVHNTLVNTGPCLAQSSWGGTGIVFANNVLYSASGTATNGFGNATVAGNVTLNDLAAFVDLKLDGSARDATPSTNSPIRGVGVAAHAVTLDLLGRTRVAPLDPGAVDADQ